MRPANRSIAAALFVCALLALQLFGQAPDCAALEDGRIGVLYVGCIARSRPFWEMRNDPLFSLTFVQATLRDWAGWGPIQQAEGESQVYRIVRLYMPRSYRDLCSRFDVIVLSNANREAVGPKNIEMLAAGVRDAGMGLFMAGGWETFGGAFARPPWGDTSVGELLPTIDVPDTWVQYPNFGLRLVIDEWEHEFISSLPWKRENAYFMTDFHHNLVRTKEGSQTLAHVEGSSYGNDPAMVTWDLQNGARVFAYTGEIYFFNRMNPVWTYYIDFGSNLMIYLDNRPVPQDIDLVHALRFKMSEIAIRKSLLLSLLEFCDRFGANTGKFVEAMDEIDQVILDARPQYFELRFEEALESYRNAGEMLADLEIKALELKDKALFWIYVIEWLAVTGTAMVCGLVLWSVMVRRKLYREVRMTRLTDRPLDV